MNPIQEKIAVITDDKKPPASRSPRWVALPALRPSLDLCLATPVTLQTGDRVIIAQDQSGVTPVLAAQLKDRGVIPLLLDPAQTAVALTAQLQTWLEDGRIRGIYWLPALDAEPDYAHLSLAGWHELRRVRLTSLETVTQTWSQTDGFLVAATRLDGLLGYGDKGARNPLGGAVAAFVQAYKQKHSGKLAKVIDFAPEAESGFIAGALLAETIGDAGATAVGHWRGQRFTPSFAAQPAASLKPGISLNRQTVFLVAGIAASFVQTILTQLAAAHDEAASENVVDLAMAGSGQFYLWDALPEDDTAVQQLVQAIEKAGGDAIYRQIDLADSTAVASALQKMNGQIDVLLHADGRPDSLFNLLQASQSQEISVIMAFNGVDGRSGPARYPAVDPDQALISKLVSHWHFQSRGLVINWLERDERQGPAVVLRELRDGQAQGEYLAGKNLADWLQEDKEANCLDAAQATQRLSQAGTPLVDKLTRVGRFTGLHAQTNLRPEALALAGEKPQLPWGVGLEALAELALAAAPNYHVAVIENARFAAPLLFEEAAPQVISSTTAVFPAVGNSLLAHGRVSTTPELIHLTAQVRLVPRPVTGRPQIHFTPPDPNQMVINPSVFYAQTTAAPAWQLIDQAHVVGDQIVALLRQPLPPALADDQMIYSPAMFTFALQAADLWQFYRSGRTVRPLTFQSATVFRNFHEVAGRPIFAAVRTLGNGRAFDIQIVDEDAFLLGIVTGYQSRQSQ